MSKLWLKMTDDLSIVVWVKVTDERYQIGDFVKADRKEGD